MIAVDPRSLSEREQTDESLRVERDKADQALGEKLAALEETADAIISLARARADRVLAEARAKTDRRAALASHGAVSRDALARERGIEDAAVREERADADENLRVERAEQVAAFATEREETDKDLFSERVRSDVALATRDDFLGIVSHDLRNMLGAMVSSASLIVKGVTTHAPQADVLAHAQRIQRSGARMNRLIGDLVDVASMHTGRLAVTRELGDATQVATEAVETFRALAAARGVALAATVVPPVPRAAFDSARVLQVLTNLLSNAIKFTPTGGSVGVRVERAGDDLRFAVRDTGEGIPADKLESIFERLVQVTHGDRRGVGLGLYISKIIVEGHDGRIWADSRPGEGSTFYFTLPAHRADDSAGARPSAGDAPQEPTTI